MNRRQHSYLAWQVLGELHELEVLRSAAGWYIGAADDMGPVSRDSGYYPTEEHAREALRTGTFQQRMRP